MLEVRGSTWKIHLLFYIICCNCVIIRNVKSDESTNPSTSTLSTSSVEPTLSTTDRLILPTIPSSSSSSSSSVEDQLTPLLLNTSSSRHDQSGLGCVTCPQTVCTLSKVSYVRKTVHYNWRVDGLPNYITYLEKFQTPFEMTSNVRFNTSSPNDGNWTFTFTRFSPDIFAQTSDKNTPLELSVMYQYATETSTPPRLSFDLWLSAHMEDEYVTFPSQISSRPSSSNAVFGTRSGAYGYGYVWTYLFVWSDLQSHLASLVESVGQEGQSIIFKFVINSYQEEYASSADANCHNFDSTGEKGNESSGSSSGSSSGQQNHRNQYPHGSLYYEPNPVKNATWPPFLHHMHAIMKDDKYTDLTVKSGDEEFQIHRVIAAFSSPVLATMIFNKTYEKSESLLDFGEDIGSDVVEELIRYMYTGRVEDIEEIADRLIVAATQYGFPTLKKLCESALIKQVKTENAFSMYELGAEVGSMRLKRRAFNIMKENKSKIVAQSEEFRKLSVHHPDVMYELFLS